MGLNMPAKTVVFLKTRKFDGDTNRWINASEYAAAGSAPAPRRAAPCRHARVYCVVPCGGVPTTGTSR
jgi:hypothetical protein